MKKVQYIDSDIFAPDPYWSQLSLRDKAAVIKAGVANGFRRMPDIKAAFSNYMEINNQ